MQVESVESSPISNAEMTEVEKYVNMYLKYKLVFIIMFFFLL